MKARGKSKLGILCDLSFILTVIVFVPIAHLFYLIWSIFVGISELPIEVAKGLVIWLLN